MGICRNDTKLSKKSPEKAPIKKAFLFFYKSDPRKTFSDHRKKIFAVSKKFLVPL